MNMDIGTGHIELVDYLPPIDVVREWVIGSILAFVIVQIWKNWRRKRRSANPDVVYPRLTRFEMGGTAGLIAFVLIWLNLAVLTEYTVAEAAVYAMDGGIFAPAVITALLWLLDHFAPGLRQQLSQDRRVRDEKTGKFRRVDDPDSTGNFL